jgi:hypothetical protein
LKLFKKFSETNSITKETITKYGSRWRIKEKTVKSVITNPQ